MLASLAALRVTAARRPHPDLHRSLLVTAILGGMWSDRIGRRKPFVIGATVVMAAGAIILAFVQTWEAAMVAASVRALATAPTSRSTRR